MKNKTKSNKKEISVKEKRIMATIAAAVIILGFVLIFMTIYLGSRLAWMKTVGYVALAVFLLSLVLMIALDFISKKVKIIGYIYNAACWNTLLLGLIIKLIFPSMLILLGLIFIILFPFGSVRCLLLLLSEVVKISPQTILFLSLTIGSVISAYYSKPLFRCITKFLTMNGHRYELYFPKMVEYVFKPVNLQFVVYSLYVLYLVVSTIFRFEKGDQPMIGNNMDLAVLESFLVFIAFSNMKMRLGAVELKFSELFKIMYGMWTTHDDDGNIEGENNDNSIVG